MKKILTVLLPPLKTLLNQYNLRAKKSLGQNFLLNPAILHRIVQVAGPTSSAFSLQGESILEIGPGPGGLTRELLAAGADKVIAIERDDRCIQVLETLKEAALGRLIVISKDAQKISPQSIMDEFNLSSMKIVANLPYNIATALLTQWLKDLNGITSLTLMFQKEVALRLIAPPNTKAYGRLSILTQWLCTVEKAFDLPPEAFTPPPKVTSSVVKLTPNPIPAAERALIPFLEKVTQQAFGQRRKMLRSSLRNLFTTDHLESLDIDPTKRAETLTISAYLKLAEALRGSS